MPTLIEIFAGQLNFLGAHFPLLQVIVLIPLLVVATVVDVRERRIPNWLVSTGIVSAFVLHMLPPQGQGVTFALCGLAMGIAALLPMYMLSVMGAGDVKFMGMIGAFLGIDEVLGAVLASMVAGGVLALAMAACKRMLPQLLSNMRTLVIHHQIKHMTGNIPGAMPPAPSIGKMPYAVAITAGTLIQLFFLPH